MRNLNKNIMCSVLGVYLISGCSGEVVNNNNMDYSNFTRNDFNDTYATFTYFGPRSNRIDFLGTYSVKDEDGDGIVDIIFKTETFYVTSELVDESRFVQNIMTPEIMDAATKFLHANRELSFLIAKHQSEKKKE